MELSNNILLLLNIHVKTTDSAFYDIVRVEILLTNKSRLKKI